MTLLSASAIDLLVGKIASWRASVAHPLVVVVGPTGTGKTALSISLAKRVAGEVVNADSRQLYRGLEIGAAVATEAERQGIPHHLLCFLDPDQVFTLSDYQAAAFSAIDAILSRGKLPLLVGGTGLYVNAVCLNYHLPPVPPDPPLRASLAERLRHEGFESLRRQLAALDPQAASRLQSGQQRALLRALEIASHGTTKTESASCGQPRYDCLFVLLQAHRDRLRERLARRVQAQLAAGVLDEVAALMSRGYDERTHALSGISCKEWIPFLRGQATLEACTEETIRNNLRYAKRQATWFRGLQRKISQEHVIAIEI